MMNDGLSKEQEAIYILKHLHDMYDVNYGDWTFVWTAIRALEKQIPKKLLDASNGWDYKCPSCGSCFDEVADYTYCPCCGQALAWGGVDDN